MFYSPRGQNQFKNYALDNVTAQKFLEIVVSKRDISDFFAKTGIQRITIAPYNHISECLIRMISNNVEVTAIADKNYKKYPMGYKGVPILSYDEMIDRESDAIIITSSFHMNDIIDTLLELSVPLEKIIGINTILYGLERML